LALATVSVIATHILSIKITGIKDYLSRYISFNPVNVYVGLLELVAEVMKILSLSFRLFGNIFAGEVALHTVSALFAFLAPLPFLLLESIVSVVQALVFSILTLVFMSILTTPHHAHEKVHDQ
jgi:F-type H+-transporting ATPase subunit a